MIAIESAIDTVYSNIIRPVTLTIGSAGILDTIIKIRALHWNVHDEWIREFIVAAAVMSLRLDGDSTESSIIPDADAAVCGASRASLLRADTVALLQGKAEGDIRSNVVQEGNIAQPCTPFDRVADSGGSRVGLTAT